MKCAELFINLPVLQAQSQISNPPCPIDNRTDPYVYTVF